MHKKIFTGIIFLFFALSAFGQSKMGTTMSRADAAQAWATIINLPPDTPGVTGGGLVVESEPNGDGRKVWLAVTGTGNYLLPGKDCGNRKDSELGEMVFEVNPYSPVGGGLVFDRSKMGEAANFKQPICSVELVRTGVGGRIERSAVDINPWQAPSADTPKLQVGSEGVKDGRYFIATGVLPADAVVIVGRFSVGEIQRSPTGAIVFFPAEGLSTIAGPTTVTLCTKGRCGTTTYDRKVVVEYPGGKG